MGALFRYELKKLLSRRLVWLIVALCAAYMVFINRGTLSQLWGGYVQGMKDVYAQYEGLTVTDALKQEAKDALSQYADDHPSHVQRWENPDGSVDYMSTAMGLDYYSGVCVAYQEIGFLTSVEDIQSSRESRQLALDTGKNPDGSPLPGYQRKQYEQWLNYKEATPAVHYAMAWYDATYFDFSSTGPILLFLLAIFVLPSFGRESSSRMEGVLFCAAGRNRAAVAKMLAAAFCAGALVLLFYGLELAISAATYGLDGAFAPARFIWGDIPNAAAFAFALLAAMLAAAACASLTAFSSALSRNMLLSLLFAAAFIGVQILISAAIQGGIAAWLFRKMDNPLLEPPWYYGLRQYAGMLPAVWLTNHNSPIGFVSSAGYALFWLGFPALLSALLCWLAPGSYFRPRRA